MPEGDTITASRQPLGAGAEFHRTLWNDLAETQSAIAAVAWCWMFIVTPELELWDPIFRKHRLLVFQQRTRSKKLTHHMKKLPETMLSTLFLVPPSRPAVSWSCGTAMKVLQPNSEMTSDQKKKLTLPSTFEYVVHSSMFTCLFARETCPNG